MIADGPTPGSWTGLSGLAQGHRAWLSAWERLRSQAHEYRQLDDERVLVLTLYSGRGKTSGVELEQLQAKGAGGAHIHDGKVIKLVWYTDRENACADLGVEE